MFGVHMLSPSPAPLSELGKLLYEMYRRLRVVIVVVCSRHVARPSGPTEMEVLLATLDEAISGHMPLLAAGELASVPPAPFSTLERNRIHW